jgi:hypothetical protein
VDGYRNENLDNRYQPLSYDNDGETLVDDSAVRVGVRWVLFDVHGHREEILAKDSRPPRAEGTHLQDI